MSEFGGPWQHISGMNWAVYSGGVNGSRYLEMNTGSAGAGSTLWQDFPLASNWSNYTQSRTFISTPDTWTVRLWMRAPGGCCVTGTLAVWAKGGGSQENGSTGFSLDANWKQVEATVHFLNNGHNLLEVIIYLDNVGPNYDFDGVTFQRNYANNTSFEDGFAYWSTFHQQGGCTVNYAVYAGTVPDDSQYLETNRGNCTTQAVSIIQEFATYPSANDTYSLRVWIRSKEGSAISGSIFLWANGGTYENPGTLGWSIGAGDFLWHEYTLTKTFTQGNHTSLKIELYLDTNGPNYDFDGVQLWGGAGG